MTAEHECPWGEMAMTYRAEYLACRIDAASDAWTADSRKDCQKRAQRIKAKLFGAPPERRGRRSVMDVIGGFGNG